MIALKVNARDAIDTLNSLINGLNDAVIEGMLDVAEDGQKVAQRRSKGSVRNGIEVKRRGRNVALVSTAPWSSIVEGGRGPVYAKDGEFLRFQVGGRVVFTKRVGPARPRPFMKPAGVKMAQSVAVDDAIERLLR